ncbi:MAG: Ribose operon repressor [Lentisphaerae bacterium ADurb.Bin242]|nr:MAG: Ribose operon repressor [Lentisphaerae bacterium ADurb.Bin242]
MEATIKDVARESGVSTMTVTRAFRSDALVSTETRRKVLDAAKKLNYRPNLSARVLRGGSSRSVGILLSNPAGNSIVRRISEKLLPDNYVTYIVESLGDLNIIHSALQEFENRRVDAIVMEWRPNFFPLEPLIERHKNVILFTREGRPEYPCDCCFLDYKPAIREAVEYLLWRGRRNIYYLGREDTVEIRDMKKVLEGFRLPFNHIETSLFRSKPAFANYYDALKTALRSGKRPDVVFTFGDMAAMQVCRCVADFGLKVPGDIAVIGHGNNDFSEFMQPPIASLEGFADKVAEKVCDMLVNRLQNPDSSKRSSTVEAEFIKRASAG